MNALPIIAITMGDPASIGPEIAVKALLQKSVHEICKPLIVDDAKVFGHSIDKLNLMQKLMQLIQSVMPILSWERLMFLI